MRDFRGVPTNAFDGRGNYTLGLKDQLIFPEVDYAKVDKLRGMNVTFVTSARTDEESQLLLQYLGMPFRTQQEASLVAKLSLIAKAQRTPKFAVRKYTRCRRVRPSPGLPAEVPAVPHLLPAEAALSRGHPRRHQGQLVAASVERYSR